MKELNGIYFHNQWEYQDAIDLHNMFVMTDQWFECPGGGHLYFKVDIIRVKKSRN